MKRTDESILKTVAKGVAAGVAGTAAMTVSSTIEQHLRKRPPSTAPADAAAKVLGIKEFPSDDAKNKFSNAVHWGYGTSWGVNRALLSRFVSPRVASTAHLGALWVSEQVMLPALEVAPPVTMWGGKEVAIDAWHHLVYATATSAAYEALERR
ncbi:MAG TPA: hypothetical protein VE570_11825 [Thermoleophilaceae bacterium]|jgi:hypothetical protein|nr:hypothetical protein [Thermoleophilaceae bacterium]